MLEGREQLQLRGRAFGWMTWRHMFGLESKNIRIEQLAPNIPCVMVELYYEISCCAQVKSLSLSVVLVTNTTTCHCIRQPGILLCYVVLYLFLVVVASPTN